MEGTILMAIIACMRSSGLACYLSEVFHRVTYDGRGFREANKLHRLGNDRELGERSATSSMIINYLVYQYSQRSSFLKKEVSNVRMYLLVMLWYVNFRSAIIQVPAPVAEDPPESISFIKIPPELVTYHCLWSSRERAVATSKFGQSLT